MTQRDPIIEHAASKVGGMGRLSEALGLSRAAVFLWKRVPPNRILAVEKLTGVPREKLRPDLYRRAKPPAVSTSDAPIDPEGVTALGLDESSRAAA